MLRSRRQYLEALQKLDHPVLLVGRQSHERGFGRERLALVCQHCLPQRRELAVVEEGRLVAVPQSLRVMDLR